MTRRIDQVLDTLVGGDAISDYARYLQTMIRARGIACDIVAKNIGASVAAVAQPFASWRPQRGSATIYHYAIGSDVSARVARIRGRKALVYHNITPEAFFRPYDPAYADVLAAGRRDLRSLAARFDVLLGLSEYNAVELASLTGRQVESFRFVIDPARLKCVPDATVVQRPKPGARWLTVGRVVPNKGLLRLVDVFSHFVAHDPGAELAIVGRYMADDRFYGTLRSRVSAHGLDGRVVFTGGVTPAALAAWYATSDVFVSLSEHEGFCVPLVEAMYSCVPVVAAATTAIPETLGAAGLLVEDQAKPGEIAALIAVLLGDKGLRETILAAQRERCSAFVPGSDAGPLLGVLERLSS
jgi:glycosyltransferase involved in cell wall biosynthesis